MPGPAYQVLHSVHSFGEDLSIARTNPLKSHFLQGNILPEPDRRNLQGAHFQP
jgi:hypothetical protein